MKGLIVLAILLTFLPIAAAQEIPQPTVALSQHANPPAHSSQLSVSDFTNLVFYGGDPNLQDRNDDGFADGNTLLVPDTTTYAAVDVPKSTKGVITGILFMILPTKNDFNPLTATYDIRIGLSDGNGGTSVASGSGPMTYKVWMFTGFGTYYFTTVDLTVPLTVTPGKRYWFNLSPQCTDSGDPNCDEQFFVNNTTQETDGLHANAQPAGQMFFNSAYFGYTWVNWCDSVFGLNAQQCARASFGLMGHP